MLTSIPLKKYMLASKQAFSDVVTRFVGLETANTNIGSTLFGVNHAVLPNHQGVQNLSSDPVITLLSDGVEKLEVEAGFLNLMVMTWKCRSWESGFLQKEMFRPFLRNLEAVYMMFPPDWFGILTPFFRIISRDLQRRRSQVRSRQDD